MLQILVLCHGDQFYFDCFTDLAFFFQNSHSDIMVCLIMPNDSIGKIMHWYLEQESLNYKANVKLTTPAVDTL